MAKEDDKDGDDLRTFPPVVMLIDKADQFDHAVNTAFPQFAEDQTAIISKRDEKSDAPLVMIKHQAVINRTTMPVATVMSARQFLLAAESIRHHYALNIGVDPVDPATAKAISGVHNGIGWDAVPAYVIAVEGDVQVSIAGDLASVKDVAELAVETLHKRSSPPGQG